MILYTDRSKLGHPEINIMAWWPYSAKPLSSLTLIYNDQGHDYVPQILLTEDNKEPNSNGAYSKLHHQWINNMVLRLYGLSPLS